MTIFQLLRKFRQISSLFMKNIGGGKKITHKTRNLSDLPKEALSYIERIEVLIGVKITVISTSPDREDTILLQNPYLNEV